MKIFRYFPLPLLFLFPALVQAADNTPGALNFTPPQSDVSVILLAKIFGIVDGVLYGTSSQIMGEMFGVFNAAVLALGGIILMYSLLVSTMNTAHEGEFLGRKWSSVWIPVRSVVGVALLIPKATGYSVIQIFVMWVVLQGVGAADKVWNAALDYLSRGGIIVGRAVVNVERSPQASKKFTEKVGTAGKLLTQLVCMNALQTGLDKINQAIIEDGGESLGVVPNFSANLNFLYVNPVADLVRVRNARKDKSKASPVQRSLNIPDKATVFTKDFTGACGTLSWEGIDLDAFISNLQRGGGGASGGGLFGTGVGFKQGQAARGDRLGQDEGIGDAITQGKSLWSAGDPSTAISDLISSATAGKFTLSPQALKDTVQSRDIAVQQVFLDLNSTARTIVNNAFDDQPQILGILYLKSLSIDQSSQNIGPTAGESPAAPFRWGIKINDAYNTPPSIYDWNAGGTPIKVQDGPLLTGFELKNSLLAYLAIMRPTLNMMAGAIKGLDFIDQAKSMGWIMAGRYFYNLAALNRNVNNLNIDGDPFIKVNKSSKKPLTAKALQNLISIRDLPGVNPEVVDPILKKIIQIISLTSYDSFVANSSGKYNGNSKSVTGSFSTNSQITQISTIKPGDRKTNNNIVSSLCSVNTKWTPFNNLICYIGGSMFIPMKGEASLKPPPYKFQFNFVQIPTMDKMDRRGFMGIISGVYNAMVVFPTNNLFVPIMNLLLAAFQAAVILPFGAAYKVIFGAIYKMISAPGNPIVQIASIGDMAINAAGAIWIGGLIAVTSTAMAPFVSVAPALVGFIMPLLSTLLLSMFATGAVMAYYIPLVPYLLFTFASLGWFIAVIEAMVAAPIVAVGLTHPEGQHEVFGKAAPAVMLLTNIFLRPSMMVIAFIASIILSYVGIYLLNAGFFQTTQGMLANVSGLTSLIGPLAVIVIYASVFVIIVQKSFALIHILPDKVLRWLEGGAGAALGGEIAEGMEREAKGAAQGAAQSAGGALKSGLESFKGKEKEEGDTRIKNEGNQEGGLQIPEPPK